MKQGEKEINKLTGKTITIEVHDPLFDRDTSYKQYPALYDCDCFHIINNLKDQSVPSQEEFNHALDILIAFFVKDEISKMIIDIPRRNQSLAPEKEMTLEEIEEELGYKVKVVNKKEEKR